MPMTPQTFDWVRQLVLARSAIVLDDGKQYLVESRLGPLSRQFGFPGIDEFVGAMNVSSFGTMHRAAVEAMTTNETSFFRDNHPFEALRTVLLPDLLTRRAASRQLTIWCGAASSGQESYSVAMLLREHFPELRDWRLTFLATDLSNAILAKARSGRYSQLEVNRGLPAPLLVKYFTKDGAEWVIKDDLRQMVEFREMNLIERWPAMPSVDLVMLRNVLIYFDVEVKRTILRNVRRVMAPGAYLMLGGAETTMGIDDQFERVTAGRSVAYRVSGTTALDVSA
jgi:chemotaxis protein methyltransferase CheR